MSRLLGSTNRQKIRPTTRIAACNANIMLNENKQLQKCNVDVKNVAIKSYGSLYAIENFVVINPKLRAAHRYHTCAAHKDWRQYADLPGPDIRILRLYTAYNIDSITVIINAELYTNWYITEIIGHLDRTTI